MRAGEVPTKIDAEGYGWNRIGWQPWFDVSRLDETILSYKPEKS